MTCNCHETMKQKLADHYAKHLPAGSTDISVALKGIKWAMTDISDDPIARNANDVEITYQAPKKSGGMKQGKLKTYIVSQFCPFCGERYVPKESSNEHD